MGLCVGALRIYRLPMGMRQAKLAKRQALTRSTSTPAVSFASLTSITQRLNVEIRVPSQLEHNQTNIGTPSFERVFNSAL